MYDFLIFLLIAIPGTISFTRGVVLFTEVRGYLDMLRAALYTCVGFGILFGGGLRYF